MVKPAATSMSGNDTATRALTVAASIAGDLADIGATTLARDGLPEGSVPATAAVAGGSLLLSALAALLNEG
jgi:hypothetical protein